MLGFYEMMYYAIYRQRLEGKTDGFNYATRFYSLLLFLNVTTLLIPLHAVLQEQGIYIEDSDSYCFLIGVVLGMVIDLLMARRAGRIKMKFENRDWSDIATWLIVYIIFSFAFFAAIVWHFQAL